MSYKAQYQEEIDDKFIENHAKMLIKKKYLPSTMKICLELKFDQKSSRNNQKLSLKHMKKQNKLSVIVKSSVFSLKINIEYWVVDGHILCWMNKQLEKNQEIE